MLTSSDPVQPPKTSAPASSPPPRASYAQEGSPDLPLHAPRPTAPSSPVLSTTSTAEEGGSSPVVPFLQAPTLHPRALDFLRERTPPPRPRTASSHYYTASWGSPYQEPPESLIEQDSQISPETSGSGSPVQHLVFHTPYLRPRPSTRSLTISNINEFNLNAAPQSGLSAAVLLNRVRRPDRGLTEDWIRQHTEADSETERANWLSDGTGSSGRSSLSRSHHSREGEDWLEDPKTPTPKTVLETGDSARRISHRRQLTDGTIRPEDFETPSLVLPESIDADMSVPRVSLPGSATLSRTPWALEEKPLPSPPQENSQEKPLPEWRASAAPVSKEAAVAANSQIPVANSQTPAAPQTATTPEPAVQRTKKKISWKGKTLAILLPLDENRGKPGHAPAPMTPAEVERMFREWEQLGYDTSGFNLTAVNEDNAYNQSLGQSREMWPDMSDVVQERAMRQFRVSIPDKREWDAYVNELAEAKLRALGVSFGDDDPPAPVISRAPSASISRPMSIQYPPLPFSPPLPTSSATSSHPTQQQNTFSPFMNGPGPSTSQSSNMGSTTSPTPMQMQAHMQKYPAMRSVSQTNSEHPFGSPFSYPQALSPGVWSPQQQMLYQQGLARGGSPSIGALNSMVSPMSPFVQDNYFPPGDAAMQLQQRQNQLHAQLLQQQQLQQFQQQRSASADPSSSLRQEYSHLDLEDGYRSNGYGSKSPSKTPQARPVGHNPSASLQKEIDDAEYHLEEQMQRELEHEDYSPHSDTTFEPSANAAKATVASAEYPANLSGKVGLSASRFASTSPEKEEGPMLHHPQPHNRGHSLSQRPFNDDEAASQEALLSAELKAAVTDVETNPSDLDTPSFNRIRASEHERMTSLGTNPWADEQPLSSSVSSSTRPGDAKKLSSTFSKLNVAAAAFNPAGSFNAGQFNFTSAPFQPAQTSAFRFGQSSGHQANPSTSSFGSMASRVNPAAPVFKPGQSDFSFSPPAGATFRPDAPVFTPTQSVFSTSVGSAHSGIELPQNNAGKIFGNIDMNLAKAVKPSKQSKAIPIVRPDSPDGKPLTRVDTSTTEDIDGRITQAAWRNKRAKSAGPDGDSVPLFADHSEPLQPLQETSREQSPAKEATKLSSKGVDKENSAENSTEDSTLLSDTEKQVEESTSSRNVSGETKSSANGFAPWEFKDPKQAEDFSAASNFLERSVTEVTTDNEGMHSDKDEVEIIPEAAVKPDPAKKHKKNSLSATAKPFLPEAETFSFNFGNAAVFPAAQPAPVLAPPTLQPTLPKPDAKPAKTGIKASMFAGSPSPPRQLQNDSTNEYSLEEDLSHDAAIVDATVQDESIQETPRKVTITSPYVGPTEIEESPKREPTYEEIDAVMRHLNAPGSELGVNRDPDAPRWHQPSPRRHIQMESLEKDSPVRLQPANHMRSDALSPTPRRFTAMTVDQSPHYSPAVEQEDPFVDEPRASLAFQSPVRLNRGDSIPESDWDDAFSEGEDEKLHNRAAFFDKRVNDLVGGLLAERLEPIEQLLRESISKTRAPSSRRNRRSVSGELPESDADDEDDEGFPRASASPRRDRKLEKIRAIINEALKNHSRPTTAVAPPVEENKLDATMVLRALDEMRQHFDQQMHSPSDLREIVEEAVERRMPPAPQPDEAAKPNELEALRNIVEQAVDAKTQELEALRNIVEEAVERCMPPLPKPDEVIIAKNQDLEARLAEMTKRVEEAEQNARAAAAGRVQDLEARLAEQKQTLINAIEKTEREVKKRRDAEDRTSEIQRLLRISSEEEDRLREVVADRDQKLRAIEDARMKTAMRTSMLEAGQANALKREAELGNRIHILEGELHEARGAGSRWQLEAERAMEAAKRHSDDAEQANETNLELRRTVERLRTQMEESIRVREGIRRKFNEIQEDMANASREVTLEHAKRAKREQELIARQEVLDARLQAESKTRERLERELERLEGGERQGMRAVSDCKKLEAMVAELRAENHEVHKSALKYQREFEEARESGLSEVQRTRVYMQQEVDSANHQVNMVRDELESQILHLRNELDQTRMDADTVKAKHEMLLEEASNSKTKTIAELTEKYENQIEELKIRHERALGNAVEDGQRSEQNLLERLTLSAERSEHLQDRVSHLEEKLEIAKSAAAAAVQAAKAAKAAGAAQPANSYQQASSSAVSNLPEKVSPQALRESILVLQEQLQDREQKIEKLESELSTVDRDAPSKITKRDDEISWLRELLAVRMGDLQDIINTLSSENYDPEAVRDAAIRLRANLQMEEQERERAMNGGSAINLPNIANTIRDVASPRVAQAVGPLAAAWGNWRKSRNGSLVDRPSTASQASRPSPSNAQSFLNGLMTPPASARPADGRGLAGTQSARAGLQPTAFGSTGRRFTTDQLANRPRNPVASTSRRGEMRGASPSSKRNGLGMGMSERERMPQTPPMLRPSSYDADAREAQESFSDAGFDDEGDDEDSSVALEGADLRR